MDNEQRADYIDFINRSFRDMADKDYIAARILYRYELGPQFLCAAHQSVEKYLKAILLYNDQGTLKLEHDICKAFRRLSDIKDIPFKIPKDVITFIEYLNEQGNNRYLDKPAYTLGEELLQLDRTVWYIRRYCRYMRGESTPGADGKRMQLFPMYIADIKASRVSKANKYRISGGFLEKVLVKKGSDLRTHLVWKNFYYGAYKKKAIKHFTLHSWSLNPSHFLHPEIYSILNKRVKFSKKIQELFEDHETES